MARGHSYTRAMLQELHGILVAVGFLGGESGLLFWSLPLVGRFPLKIDTKTEISEIEMFS